MAQANQTPTTGVRVLVVDNQRLMREGLATLLAIDPRITVVGTAVNGTDAVKQAKTLVPNVILMGV